MAAFSFILWGLLPLYYQYLPNAAMDELLAIRLAFSVPFGALLVLVITKQWPKLKTIFDDKVSLAYSTAATVMMSISWTAFIWALTNDRVMDASLGYFIAPITMMALGVFLLKERLSPGKKAALVFACIGLSYQMFHYGQVPYVALTMAIFFSFYGWCKKKANYDWSTGLFVEALVVLPIAVGYILFKEVTVGAESLHSGGMTFLLYVGAAPVTLAPLIFYSIAIRLTTMSTIGLMQYIEPSIQFVLALYLFGEAFDQVKAVSFGFIWLGLTFTIIEGIKAQHKMRARRSSTA